jgi:hypothetical protein
MKSLMLTAGPEGSHVHISGAALDTMDGLAKLVSTVGKLVQAASHAHTQRLLTFRLSQGILIPPDRAIP